jgi:membrane protein
MTVISDQVNRLAESSTGKLGVGVILGLATTLWSANQGTKAFFSALNVVKKEKERRGFFTLSAQSLAFTAAAICFILLAMLAVIVMPIVLNLFGLPGDTWRLLVVARWPLIMLVFVFFLACLNYFGPSRVNAEWRWVTYGSAFASVAWVSLSIGFSWYVEHFDSFDKTYGSLGAVIGFMTWIWLSTSVMLIGAQLDTEAESLRAGDGAVCPGRPS